MGVNVLLFLVFQIGVEPWKRKRLVKGFEEKVLEALGRDAPPMGVATRLTDMETSQNPPASGAAARGIERDVYRAVQIELPASMEKGIPDDASSAGEVLLAMESKTPLRSSVLGKFKEKVRDLFSDRPMTVRRVDITTIALEGAAAGMALVGLAVLLSVRLR